jgi:hypothetical protein
MDNFLFDININYRLFKIFFLLENSVRTLTELFRGLQ